MEERATSGGPRFDGAHLKSLHEALLDAFSTREALAQMVRFELDARLGEIAGPEDQRSVVFSLIQWAEALGKLEALVGGALNANPGNEKLRAIGAEILGSSKKPSPHYPDPQTRLLSQQLEAARAREEALRRGGHATEAAQREILTLRRQLREGGHFRAGDSLSNGRYLLLDVIGRGGFASVWRAEDRVGERLVAIKVLHANLASDEVKRERFFRGARVMMELEHRAVVKVLEKYGEDGGFFYFVMEHIEGPDLRHAVLNNLLLPEQVLPVILGAGEALAAAHAKGVVHRDVKPANILIDAAMMPRLTDFDLAAVGDSTGGTRTGALGTFLYAAPEMLERPQDADARADVYGLGMTAIFSLHGAELPAQSLRGPDRVIRGLRCKEAIKHVLSQAVEIEAGDRYADAGAFCAALREACLDRPPRHGEPRVEPKEVPPPLEMVEIPAGSFLMGSPDGEAMSHPDERPQHEVTISRFWMARMQVTQRLFREVMGQNAGQPEEENLPVNRISWEEAITFCNRLSALEGLRPAYRIHGAWVTWDRQSTGYRLPTEAEWEYAARGPEGWVYPWGDAPPSNQLCWSGEGNDLGPGGRTGPAPVGSYPDGASPFGLLDMAGNVLEWCWDWYVPYVGSAEVDPAAPSNGTCRVIRGGSWDGVVAGWMRAANRSRVDASVRSDVLGFRCARGASQGMIRRER